MLELEYIVYLGFNTPHEIILTVCVRQLVLA